MPEPTHTRLTLKLRKDHPDATQRRVVLTVPPSSIPTVILVGLGRRSQSPALISFFAPSDVAINRPGVHPLDSSHTPELFQADGGGDPTPSPPDLDAPL